MAARPDDLTSESAEILIGVLDETERSRLASLKNNDTRRQYLVGHALMRVTLSAMGPAMPDEWRFDRTPWGQPGICHPQSAASVFFSLSHTMSLVVCAVSAACKVGVDAEKIDASVEVAELAPHVLSEEEREWWHREEPATRASQRSAASQSSIRLSRFYQLWTLKESLLKTVGRGLHSPPSCLSFRLTDGIPPQLMQLPEELGRRGEWSFRVFEPTQVHVCALTAHVPASEPLRVSWRHVEIEELVAMSRGNGVQPGANLDSVSNPLAIEPGSEWWRDRRRGRDA